MHLRNQHVVIFFVGMIISSMILLSGCRSRQEIGYLQNIEQIAAMQFDTTAFRTARLQIKPSDYLSIVVSAEDPVSVIPFNLPATQQLLPGQLQIAQSVSLQTYQVSPEGKIKFPVLGEVEVQGLTKEACSRKLEEMIGKYVKHPIVTLHLQDVRYNVLGEVTRPGSYVATRDHFTLLDALSAAGDLTLYGKRDNILLLRENNGRKEMHRFDLTDANLLNSPYFYLQQNDVIYVEPNSQKKKNARYGQSDSFNISLISTIVSTVSVISSVLITLLLN